MLQNKITLSHRVLDLSRDKMRDFRLQIKFLHLILRKKLNQFITITHTQNNKNKITDHLDTCVE